MAGGYTAQPDGMDALVARVRKLEQELSALRSAASIRASTISQGGLTISDGGTLRVIDSGGQVIAEFGSLPAFAPKPDGTPQVGWVLRRDSGEPAGYCMTLVTGGTQAWAWTDRGGNIVLADDAFSGKGLARPYIAGHLGHSRLADMRAVTSSTFEEVFLGNVYKQHPKLELIVRQQADAAGTTGEVRVMVDGVQLGATTTVNDSLSYGTYLGTLTQDHMTKLTISVQARRTAGTGNIRLEPMAVYGKQS